MLEYKLIVSNDSALPKLWQEGWQLICIDSGKMYFSRTIKKKPTTALTVKTGTNTLNFLISCQQRAENSRIWWEANGISIDKLFEFADYWLEKWENDKKHRFEKEKVFDVRKRLRTWIDKWWNKKSEREVVILD